MSDFPQLPETYRKSLSRLTKAELVDVIWNLAWRLDECIDPEAEEFSPTRVIDGLPGWAVERMTPWKKIPEKPLTREGPVS